MRCTVVLLLISLLAACGAATGDAGGDSEELRIEVGEALAVSHLRSLVGAQIQAQALGVIDADKDGLGEFCFVSELSGAREPRAGGKGLLIPLLGNGFEKLTASGLVEVHGYVFRAFLPGADGVVIGEGADAGDGVYPDDAEKSWICYAWPVRYGETGIRTFVVDAAGVIRGVDEPKFSGTDGPHASAALVDGQGLDRDFRPEWTELR